MTSDEFAQMCRDICPHCNAGIAVRQRPDTSEFVHDFVSGPVDPKIGRPTGMGHSICMATHWRNKNQDQVVG